MSYVYGRTSQRNRDSCAPPLIEVMNKGLEVSPVDISIVSGWRDEDVQTMLFRTGASKKEWPFSEHNFMLNEEPHSKAFDFAPHLGKVIKIPWEDTHLFAVVAGVFISVAKPLGIKLRWGGDWDMDGLTTDQTFMDWGHLEIEEYDP